MPPCRAGTLRARPVGHTGRAFCCPNPTELIPANATSGREKALIGAANDLVGPFLPTSQLNSGPRHISKPRGSGILFAVILHLQEQSFTPVIRVQSPQLCWHKARAAE